ncbi:MAG: transglutaminase TgpA family protein [Bryobacteraceae bacterium]
MGTTPAQAPAPPRAIDRFFEFSLLGMLAAGFLALAGSGYLDWATITLTLLGFSLRGLMSTGVLRIEFSNRAIAAATIAYAGFWPVDYFFISGSFLMAAVHLVCFLAVIKVLTARTARDFAYVKAIAVLELLAAAILPASASFFAYLALFLLLAIATFASGEVRRAAQSRGAVVRAGLRGFSRRLGALSAFLFLGILAMTTGMFFILPRTARAALERFVPERYHLPGFSNSITLDEIGEIKKSSAPVMHIQSYADDGPMNVRWRGGTLTRFDGQRWDNPPEPDIELPVERGVLTINNRPHPRRGARPARTMIYTVRLNDIAAGTLFIAGVPQTISIGLPYVRLTSSGSFEVTPAVGMNGFTYGVYSFIEDADALEPPTGRDREDLLELPPLDPRIPALARKMSAGAPNDAREARQIESHLRHDYGYTLDLLSTPVADPLTNFLFVRKKGHCEYFASAMAVMLRTLGIPSRVVTGFQSGVYNPITHQQVVRASDAHSWVEAWIDGRGWTTFDPTPPDPHAAGTGVMARLSMLFDAAGQFWQDWVVSYDLDRQIALASRMDESARRMRFGWFGAAGARIKNWARAGSAYLPEAAVGAGLAILLALYGSTLMRWWRGRLRVRRLVRGEGEASDATLLYERMLAALAKRGIQKPSWLTPVEFARVIPNPETGVIVGDLTAFYNQLRFGGRGEAAAQMIELLEELEKRS